MPNIHQYDQPKEDQSPEQRHALHDVIREQILRALGRPADLLKVQIRKVWDEHYRVNVLVGPDAGSVRLANSYFVVVNSAGGLVTTTPTIEKMY